MSDLTQENSPELDSAIQAYREGNLTLAAEACQAVLEVQPTAAGAWHLLGLITLKSKDYDRAERYLMRAVNLKPNAWSFHLNLGAVRAAAGRPHQALLAYRAAATLQPRSADAHYNLGNALMDLGRNQDAETAYKKAIELSPDDADIWSKLAATQASIHKAEAACRSAREALDLNANHSQARETLARALVDRCEIDAAERELQQLVDNDLQNPESTDLLGRIMLTRGQHEKGWALRREAFEKLARAVGLDKLWDGQQTPDQLWLEGSSEIAENVSLARLTDDNRLASSTIHLRCPESTHDVLATVAPKLTLHGEEDAIDTHMPLAALTALPALLGLDTQQLHDALSSEATTAPEGAQKIGLCLEGAASGDLMARDLAPLVQLKNIEISALHTLADPTPMAVSVQAPDETRSLRERIELQQLIIGGDGPITRLAVQMGKPVWLLCARFPDWLWGLDSEQSSIHPNVRLFRQARCGDWHAPVGNLTAALRKLSP